MMAETAGSAPADRVGILGGGQLALFLCEAGRRLGMETTVIAHGEDSPAATGTDRLLRGRLDDSALIDALVSDVDVITFEVEDIPPQTLKRLASHLKQGHVQVHPHPSSVLMLQDKLLQQRWLLANGLPTNLGRSLGADAQGPGIDDIAVGSWFGYPFVQKARRGGYDGKGVQVIRSPGSPRLWPVPSVVEPFLADVRELAVLAVRRMDGQVDCYPPVELEFDPQGNVLRRVVAPARIPSRQAELAGAIARRAISRLHGAGVFAVELFLTPGGEMLVNEISPRVHNSGHHTLESCPVSQFEQHMRVITGRPPGPTHQERPAVMVNLLSDGHMTSTPDLRSDHEGVHLHWYGKRTPRPLRKMGHVTAVAPTHKAARARADRAEAILA